MKPVENRQYKDSVFTDLFYSDEGAKERLLSVYNALCGTSYTDPSLVEKVRLDDVLYRNQKNDLACIIKGHTLFLGEHQSTVNPNMPLRMLLYIGREYEKLVPSERRYSRRQVKVPTPEFVVFYNGQEEYPEEMELRLSDAFCIQGGEPALELRVRVLNINEGHNPELMERCPELREYSQFVAAARKYQGEPSGLTKAVYECIQKGILKGYLERKSKEVINMLMDQYDYETDLAVQVREAVEDAENRNRALMKALEEAERRSRAAVEEKNRNREEMAMRMLRKGCYGLEEIAEISSLSVEELRKLSQRL